MQTSPNKQNYQPVAEQQPTADVTYTPNRNNFLTPGINLPISTVHVQSPETSALGEYRLITFGQQLAAALAKTLEQLAVYNKEAIHPIVAVLEPYMNVDRELQAHVPPKSSREVVLEVTRQGKAKPRASLD